MQISCKVTATVGCEETALQNSLAARKSIRVTAFDFQVGSAGVFF